ncbi:hypothetical protein GTW25_00170 [Aliihoeflea aestuarii]|uniref:helix-turn-helix domain-containing protein n=1 Tax=Aliihoeflea aestuarii TaxID=453840 RepID=UPI002093D971|nr:helix-turn-helix domain-containing protein [Aliihoeflea aestuarii]MCO6389445.1 hypothetical protein [Aliihoeflea aestuarii]
MSRLPESSVLIALKAIGLAPGFTGDTRRVAAAILDHFNHKTGRCDPSNERLATLLGISVRMVRKATKELCDGPAPLFEKVSHGGHSHCASYTPLWATFARVVSEWNSLMKGASMDAANRNNRACSTGTSVPVEQEQPCLQTSRRNQLKEPEQVEGQKPAPSRLRSAEPSNGLMTNRRLPSKQVPMLLPVVGGRSAAKADAAEAARYRKIAAEINRLPKHERAAAWLAQMGER